MFKKLLVTLFLVLAPSLSFGSEKPQAPSERSRLTFVDPATGAVVQIMPNSACKSKKIIEATKPEFQAALRAATVKYSSKEPTVEACFISMEGLVHVLDVNMTYFPLPIDMFSKGTKI